MSEDNDQDQKNDKWELVDRQMSKRKQDLPQPVSNPLAPTVISGETESRGVLENYKTKKIEREQRIQVLTETTKGQLAVWKHYVEGKVVVAKQQIDASVEAQLMEIGRHHLRALQEIGISNFVDRQRALEELSKRSAEQMERINSLDVPATMKQKLLGAVVEGWERLFDKIQSEEIRSGKTQSP